MIDFKALKEGVAEVPPVVNTIERQRLDCDPALAGASIRKVHKSLENWPVVQLNVSLVRVSDEFRMADSIKKPGQEAPEHRRGDLLKREHRRIHWWLSAAFPPLKLAFMAHWEQKRGRTARSAPSFGFAGAHARDPFGLPTEFFADYSLGARDTARKKDEPDWSHAERVERMERDARVRDQYNDGASWMNKAPMFTAFKEFSSWLEEANMMVARVTKRKEEA